MNRRVKVVLALTVAALAVAVLFPPYRPGYGGAFSPKSRSMRVGGFDFIGDVPFTRMYGHGHGPRGDTKLDASRCLHFAFLALELIAILGVGAALSVALWDRPWLCVVRKQFGSRRVMGYRLHIAVHGLTLVAVFLGVVGVLLSDRWPSEPGLLLLVLVVGTLVIVGGGWFIIGGSPGRLDEGGPPEGCKSGDSGWGP